MNILGEKCAWKQLVMHVNKCVSIKTYQKPSTLIGRVCQGQGHVLGRLFEARKPKMTASHSWAMKAGCMM